MKVKIQNFDGHSRWDGVRELFVLILWSAILVAAAFGWGMIYENRRHESLQEKVYNLETKVKDVNGRVTSLEGRPTQKAPAAGAEGRRQ